MLSNDDTQEMVPLYPDSIASVEAGSTNIHVRSIKNRRSSHDDRYAVGEGVIQTASAAKMTIALGFGMAQGMADQYQTQDSNCATTLTSMCITPDKKLVCGNLGDSPAYVIVRDINTGEIQIEQVSYTHNLSNPLEAAKALGHDTSKKPPASIMTAAIKPPLKARVDRHDNPVFKEVDLSAMLADPNKEVYVMVTSDGALPEYVNNHPEFKSFLQEQLQNNSPNVSAMLTARLARKGSTDNITILFTKVPKEIKKPIAMVVCDATGGNGDFAEKVCDIMREATIAPSHAREHDESTATGEQWTARPGNSGDRSRTGNSKA